MASRFYRVPLVEFPDNMPCWGPRRGVLIGSGCGLMTAVMDQVPFRWCVDTDDLRGARGVQLASFMHMAAALGPLAVCGWFSYSDPEPLRAAVLACPDPAHVPVYFGALPSGCPNASLTLSDFLYSCTVLHSGHAYSTPA